MGLRDVLRDTNSWSMEQAVFSEQAIQAEVEKLEKLPDDDLWDMHTALGMISAKGLAVALVLKKRFPGNFRE